MGKGSGRRPTEVTDKELEKAWNGIFDGHPNEEQFERSKKPRDPDRFVDDSGDA
jgi:hypothetical protein